MKYENIQLVQQAGAAILTLNRPEKRNAISQKLISELLAALDEVAQSGARVLTITGAGKAFCSGMDLDELRGVTSRSEAENIADSQIMARLFRSVYEFRLPTIAAVNGAAIAGGCGIATLCDFTLASTEARFGYTEVKIGFLPAIVSTFLMRQVGEKRARDLLLTGRIIGPEEAREIGLVNEIVAPDRLMERARELAALLMENSPASLAATKRLLAAYAGEELDEQIRLSVEENARIRATHDFREGVSSFLEKRKPRWSSK
ncbi:MAG: enoyl-CoA hydratase/isomerase family protein [Terriglobales bacterium]